MYDTLVVNSSVSILEGCGITYSVQGSDAVYVIVSGKAQPFEFFFQAEALRTFLEQGTKAMAEADTLAEQEAVEREPLGPAESAQAATASV